MEVHKLIYNHYIGEKILQHLQYINVIHKKVIVQEVYQNMNVVLVIWVDYVKHVIMIKIMLEIQDKYVYIVLKLNGH